MAEGLGAPAHQSAPWSKWLWPASTSRTCSSFGRIFRTFASMSPPRPWQRVHRQR